MSAFAKLSQAVKDSLVAAVLENGGISSVKNKQSFARRYGTAAWAEALQEWAGCAWRGVRAAGSTRKRRARFKRTAPHARAPSLRPTARGAAAVKPWAALAEQLQAAKVRLPHRGPPFCSLRVRLTRACSASGRGGRRRRRCGVDARAAVRVSRVRRARVEGLLRVLQDGRAHLLLRPGPRHRRLEGAQRAAVRELRPALSPPQNTCAHATCLAQRHAPECKAAVAAAARAAAAGEDGGAATPAAAGGANGADDAEMPDAQQPDAPAGEAARLTGRWAKRGRGEEEEEEAAPGTAGDDAGEAPATAAQPAPKRRRYAPPPPRAAAAAAVGGAPPTAPPSSVDDCVAFVTRALSGNAFNASTPPPPTLASPPFLDPPAAAAAAAAADDRLRSLVETIRSEDVDGEALFSCSEAELASSLGVSHFPSARALSLAIGDARGTASGTGGNLLTVLPRGGRDACAAEAAAWVGAQLGEGGAACEAAAAAAASAGPAFTGRVLQSMTAVELSACLREHGFAPSDEQAEMLGRGLAAMKAAAEKAAAQAAAQAAAAAAGGAAGAGAAGAAAPVPWLPAPLPSRCPEEVTFVVGARSFPSHVRLNATSISLLVLTLSPSRLQPWIVATIHSGRHGRGQVDAAERAVRGAQAAAHQRHEGLHRRHRGAVLQFRGTIGAARRRRRRRRKQRRRGALLLRPAAPFFPSPLLLFFPLRGSG